MSDAQQGNGPGKFISQKKARQMIRAFFSYRQQLQKDHGVPWNPQEDHYAYAFGLDEMKELMQKIEDYNAGSPKFPAVGVRVYNTRTLPPEEAGDDVLLVPYLSNNKNLMAVDDDLDNDGAEIVELSEDEGDALNSPRFCPPKCSQ